MIKRETIGKIQIVIGVLLIIGIIYMSSQMGLFRITERIQSYGASDYNNFINKTYTSNETRTLVYLGSDNLSFNRISMIFYQIGFLIILFILAVMFILQGLANMSGVEK